MKKIIFTFFLFTLIGLIYSNAAAVLAQDKMGQKFVRQVNQWENQSSRSAQRQTNQLERIIQESDKLIASRINSLNSLLGRIQNDNRLSDSEKSSLTSDIQADISGLNSLKAKIEADTDVTTAINDRQQIVTSYYIYAVFIPKMRLLISLNNLQAASSNLQSVAARLQNLINNLQSQGKNTSQLQSLLNDVSSQLQTINTTLTGDIATVSGVNSSLGVAAAEKTFSQVRQDISQIIRADFAKIRADFGQMRGIFSQLIKTAPATPTPTPV